MFQIKCYGLGYGVGLYLPPFLLMVALFKTCLSQHVLVIHAVATGIYRLLQMNIGSRARS